MNKVFKTIFNKSTWFFCAVAENVSNNSQVNQKKSHKKDGNIQFDQLSNITLPKNIASKTLLSIFVSSSLNVTHAVQVFDGTINGMQPVSSGILTGNFSNIYFIENDGLIATDNSEVLNQGAEIVVDAPLIDGIDFILSGYQSTDQQAADASNNQITFNTFNFNDVDDMVSLAGFVNAQHHISGIDCTDEAQTCTSGYNTLTLNSFILGASTNQISYNSDEDAITQTYNHGIAGAVKLDLSTGDVTAKSQTDGVRRADSNAQTRIENHKNQINVNQNLIQLNSVEGNLSSLISGDVEVSLKSGHAEAKNSYLLADAYGRSYIESSENNISNAENSITIENDQNLQIRELHTGISKYDINTGNAIGAESGSDVTLANRSSDSLASSHIFFNKNNIISQHNSIDVKAKNTSVSYVYGGLNYINLKTGKAIAGHANSYGQAQSSADSGINIFENEIKTIGNTIDVDANQIETLIGSTQHLNANTEIAKAGSYKRNNQTINADAFSTINAQNSLFHTGQNFINVSGNTILNRVFGSSNLLTLSTSSSYSKPNLNIAIEDQIYGAGRAESWINLSNSELTASNNHIQIQDFSEFGTVLGGLASFHLAVSQSNYGKDSEDNDLTNNESYLKLDNFKAHASHNVISLHGRTVAEDPVDQARLKNGIFAYGDIIGGVVEGRIDYDLQQQLDISKADLKANNNTINIAGDVRFYYEIDEGDVYSVNLMGGLIETHNLNDQSNDVNLDAFTGNILNYANLRPIQLNQIANFQTYNFTLNPELANTDTPLIFAHNVSLGKNESNYFVVPSVEPLLYGGHATFKDLASTSDLADNSETQTDNASHFYVTGIHSGEVLNLGDQFVLLKGIEFTGTGEGYISYDVAQQGISLLYDVETKLDYDNKQVIAKILTDHSDPEDPNTKVNPQLKSLLEGKLSSGMQINEAADQVAFNLYSAIRRQNQRQGFMPSISSAGHDHRYHSGSHIDSTGVSLNAGLSFQNNQLTFGAFVEHGSSNYDTFNSFSNATNVIGSGDNKYTGGGLFARYDFDQGLYVDTSVRAGAVKNNFSTNDLVNPVSGENANYQTKSDYLSSHAGIGYQFDIDKSNTFDLSAKYLWSKV